MIFAFTLNLYKLLSRFVEHLKSDLVAQQCDQNHNDRALHDFNEALSPSK